MAGRVGNVAEMQEAPAASAMPFWCSVELPRRSTLAKSIATIRAILERIRAAVRGDGPPATTG